MDLQRFRALSFDCYGTLVDWETGILAGLRPVLERHGVELTDEAILERYARYEAQAEGFGYQLYEGVLREVIERFGTDFGFDGAAERNALVNTFDGWRPFPDTVAALQALKRRYKLVILSNVDNDLFALTQKYLSVEFDDIITAQQIGSYKPDSRNFETLIERVEKLGVAPDELLHVAQSVYHDIVPAKKLGLATVWVNRRHDKSGIGATLPAEESADLAVPDLATLAQMAR